MSEAFKELAAVTRLLASSPRLGRALSASDVPAASKKALLTDVTRGAISEGSVETAVAAIDKARGGDATEAVLAAAVDAALSSGNAENFEVSLLAASGVLDDSQALRVALTDSLPTDESKAALVSEVFAGKVEANALDLLRTFVFVEHGRHLSQRARRVALEAAKRRDTLVADVRTAVELDETRRTSLTNALEASLGKKVQPRFTVDPSIIGSVIVRVGDEVIDGSVRRRLEQARQALAGA